MTLQTKKINDIIDVNENDTENLKFDFINNVNESEILQSIFNNEISSFQF